MRLRDKIIVVTGGSGLVGKAIVSQILVEGGKCINADIDVEDKIEEGQIKCDVTIDTSIKNALNGVHKTFGRIDGLVNCAYPRTSDWGNKFESVTADAWRKNVDMQLNSVFMVCQKALEFMISRKQGAIVNIASIYGVVGPDFSVYQGTNRTMPAAYSAIKGGIINFTRYLASYAGPSNVRVNCVSPGGIYDHQDELFVNNYEARVPLRRMGNADDVAKPICFLLSEEAKYITGHNLIVDGGWTVI